MGSQVCFRRVFVFLEVGEARWSLVVVVVSGGAVPGQRVRITTYRRPSYGSKTTAFYMTDLTE